MSEVKYLVIGAGVSGLTFTREAPGDCLVLEKENEVGGYCRTVRRGDFVWDYAGHFYHFRTDEFHRLFKESFAPDEIVTCRKNTKILYNGNMIDYPFQMNIHQLRKDEFIDCLYDLFTKTEKPEYDNFLDMLYGKFGKSITEKFLKPYNEKLYATDLSRLDVRAMGRFFPYADKEAVIRNMKEGGNSSYNDTFDYPKAGAAAFINVLARGLGPSTVRVGDGVREVCRKEKYVVTESGEKISYKYLINTMPLNRFLLMIGESGTASELSYNKVLVLNLGFNKKSPLTSEHWLYLPDKSVNAYRVGFYDNILGQDKLSMYVEIGFGKDAAITQRTVDGQLELTLGNLRRLGIIDGDTRLLDYEPIIMDPAYVHITEASTAAVKKLLAGLSGEGIYSIGRYGAWTYCSMEDCMISAKSLAEKLSKEDTE